MSTGAKYVYNLTFFLYMLDKCVMVFNKTAQKHAQ